MNICFSTEVVDLDRQAPNRNKRESKYFWDELYQLISAGGFRRIEIPYEPKWDFGGRSGIPRTSRSINVKFGDAAGFLEHLRARGLDGVDSIHFNPSLFCQGAVPMYFGAAEHFGAEAVAFAGALGCKTVTVSATPPIYAVKKLLGTAPENAFLDQTAALLETLAEKAASVDVRLCLKNEYWGLLRGGKVTAFLDRFDGRVLLDLDTAHLSIAGADILDVLAENRNRLGAVHLTDTAFTDEYGAYLTALPEFPPKAATKVFRDPGDGSLDLKGTVDAVKRTEFEGPLVLNPKDSNDICRSILRCRYFADHTLSM